MPMRVAMEVPAIVREEEEATWLPVMDNNNKVAMPTVATPRAMRTGVDRPWTTIRYVTACDDAVVCLVCFYS